MRQSKKVRPGRARVASPFTRKDHCPVDLFRAFDMAQIMVREPGGTILHVSGGLCRLYGYSADEMLGKSSHELLATEFPKPPGEIEAELLREGRWAGELKHRRRDGSTIWVSSQWAVERDGHGGALRVVEVNNEITRQKEAEQALARSEAQLRRLVDSAPVALAMFDRQMRYLAASERFREDFKLGGRELIGHSHYEIFPEIPERWKEVHRRALAGETVRNERDLFDRESGERQWTRWEIRPWYEAGGAVGGVVLHTEDITARKAAEDGLRETGYILRLAHQAGQSGAWTWDLRTNRNVWSDELWRLYGLDPKRAEANYGTWRSIVHPEDWPRVAEAVQYAAGHGTDLAFEWRVATPGSPERWVMSRGRPLFDADGVVVSYAGITVDITERKRAEEATLREQATLRGVLDATRESIWLFTTEGEHVMANRTAIARMGKPAAELIGKRIEDVLPPELAAARRAQLEQVVSTGHPVEFEDERDGIAFRHTFYPVMDRSGGVSAVVSFSRDITAQRQGERELLRNQERLALAQRAGRLGIFDWNPKEGTSIWTPEMEALFELPPGGYERSYEGWAKRVHPDDLREQEKVYAEWFASGRDEATWQYRCIRRDGGERWLEGTGRILERDETGYPTRIVGTNQDITDRKRAEETLRENEARLRLALGAAHLGTFDFEAGSDEAIWNERSRALFGMSENETLTRSQAEQRIHPEDRGEAREALAAAMTPGESGRYGCEFRIVRPDGSVRDVAEIGQVLHKGEGEQRRAARVVGIFLDITERKRVHKALRDSEEQLRTIVDNLQEGLVVVDPRGAALHWNRAALRMHGYTRQENELGFIESVSHVFEVLDEERKPIPFEGWPIQRVMRGEDLRDLELTLRNIRQGREWIFSYSGTLVRDAAGRTPMAVLTMRDVTARRLAEAALAESEARFRMLADNISQLVWIADETGARVWFNRRWHDYTGTTFEQVQGWGWWKVHHPGYVERVLEHMKAGFASGEPIELIYPLRRHDGQYRWFLSAAVPIRDGEGRILRWFGTNTDITGQKLAEDEVRELNTALERRVRDRTVQLEAANRELEAFSYSVSHDLRTPLRGIDGWSLALVEDYGDQLSEGARKYLSRVRAEAQRMGSLIDDLLQLARVSRAQTERRTVDLSALARTISGRLKEMNPGRRLEFSIEPGLEAQGDPRLLEVALTNMIENAVKFTGPREEARIEFGLERAKGTGAFYIKDNGVGFDMAYAGTLFGAFQRLHKATEFPGTGVGLATVQRVIHRHGGNIWADAAVGHGATFYFTIA